MKKILLLILAGLMICSAVGCSKNEETAEEVMEKVQQNYAEAYGLNMQMDADYTIALSGMEIKMKLEISMKQENMQDPSALIMESDMEMNMLGQSISMKEWIKDGVAYLDDSQTKTKQDLNLDELSEMSGKMGMFSQESLKQFAQKASLEKTSDGYLISGSLDYGNAFEELMGNLGLGESLGMEASEILSSLQVETFDVQYKISDEYEIEEGHVDLKASMTVEGQEVTLDLSMDLEMEAYEHPEIQLPDFSAWDMKSVSCYFEGDGISELMTMQAQEDDVTDIQSYMVLDYAANGIENEDKAAFIQNMQETYQAYEGVECTVDDLGEEIGIAIRIDMSKASISTLVELGVASESSIEGQRFSLTQSITGLEASGYDCE